jgi:hypothetical protein
MHERALEILISRAVPHTFGENYKLVAQQLSLRSGRLDLLLCDTADQLYIVEIKKGTATYLAVSQVAQYVQDLQLQAGISAIGWVVAHDIPPSIRKRAETEGVRTTSISLETCENLMTHLGMSEGDLLGDRLVPGVLAGGGVRCAKGSSVAFEVAMSSLPALTSSLIRELITKPFYESASGKMQTIITYRGIKLGGFNRTHKHFYLCGGLILSADQRSFLKENRFVYKTKTQASSSHEHDWWQSKLEDIAAIQTAIQYFSRFIDNVLMNRSEC